MTLASDEIESHATVRAYLTLNGIVHLRAVQHECEKYTQRSAMSHSLVSELADKGRLQCSAQLPTSRRVRHEREWKYSMDLLSKRDEFMHVT